MLTRAGLDPEAYRDPPVRRRINACLRALRVTSEPAARQAMTSGQGRAVTLAIDSLLLGVSGFFRDADVFAALGQRVIPDMAATGGTIRVLSIGCSTGAELYSVGMLLDDAHALDRSQLLGIDCRRTPIETARRAVYPAAEAAAVPEGLRSRAFTSAPDGVQVVQRLRDRTAWLVGDATAAVPAGPWDLVLCRNLLIYLRTPVARRLVQAIAGALAPRGVLVLGKAERPGPAVPLAMVSRCIYRRHD